MTSQGKTTPPGLQSKVPAEAADPDNAVYIDGKVGLAAADIKGGEAIGRRV